MTATISAVVTGANKGIGFEICRKLVQANVSVVLTARSVERGEAAVERLRGEVKGRKHLVLGFVQLDVADDASVSESIGRISSLLESAGAHKLDILVNNAGIAYTDATFGKAEAYETVNVNTFGTMRVTRALLPLMAAPSRQNRNAGQNVAARIVNVASIESDLSHSLSKNLRERFLDKSLSDNGIYDLMMEFVEAVGKKRHRQEGWGGTMYHASKVGQMAFADVLARELASANAVAEEEDKTLKKRCVAVDSSGRANANAISNTCIQRHEVGSITIVSCCPGFCRTDMSDFCYGRGSGQKSAAQGADTPVWLALMHGAQARASHGRFYTDRREIAWN